MLIIGKLRSEQRSKKIRKGKFFVNSASGQRKIVADDYEFWRNYAWCDEYVIYDRFGYKYKKIVVKKSLRGTLARFRKYLLSKGNYKMSWIIPGIRHLSMYYTKKRP